MGKKNKKKQDIKDKLIPQGSIRRDFFVSITTSLVLTIIGGGFIFATKLYTIPDTINRIDDSINNSSHGLAARMVRVETTVGVSGPVAENELENVPEIEEEEFVQKNNLVDKIVKLVISIKPTEAFKGLVASAAGADNSLVSEKILEEAGVTENEPIATSLDGAEEYTANDLIDQTVVLAYEEGGFQVFFQGQYNSKYHWDGECLINNYRNGRLYAATIALYDDGKRVQYRQLIADGKEWNYTERECKEDFNTGDSMFFEKKSDIEQIADFNNPVSEDLYSPSNYLDLVNGGKLLKRYHGNTSNRMLNDDTGNAYMIVYDEAGFVKTLYCGRFKNGDFDDTDIGDSWYITRNPDTGTKYEYYKGIFKQRVAVNKDNSNPDFVTKERIEEYTKGQPYEEYLKWNWDYVMD